MEERIKTPANLEAKTNFLLEIINEFGNGIRIEDTLKFRTSESKAIIKKSKKREKKRGREMTPQSHTIRSSKLLGLRLASDKRANYTHCKISEPTLTRESDKKSARVANFVI